MEYIGDKIGMIRGRWSKKQTYEKVLYVISIICSISIIIFGCTQILGVWKTGANVLGPLVYVSLLVQSIQIWKQNKKLAIAGLCVSIFLLVFSIFEFVIR